MAVLEMRRFSMLALIVSFLKSFGTEEKTAQGVRDPFWRQQSLAIPTEGCLRKTLQAAYPHGASDFRKDAGIKCGI